MRGLLANRGPAGCSSRAVTNTFTLLAASGKGPRTHAQRRLLCNVSSSETEANQPRPGKASTNLADREGSPFHELGLKDITDGMGRVRVRQHVNPLASQFQQPTPSLDWSKLYKDPSLPLFVDMGCGPGRFLLLLCKQHQRQQQRMNYLGLEIRQPLVERANKWARELGMDGQVQYIFTNVSISLAGLLANYSGPIATLSAQFPDPHFKKRHKKRRMVQQSVVEAARELLMPGGNVFLQSDVYDAVVAMRDEFEQHAGDVLVLSPLHVQAASVFQWTPEQEAAEAAAAAAAVAAAKARQKPKTSQQEQRQEQQQQPDHEEMQDNAAAAAEEEEDEDGRNDDKFVSTWAAGGWLVDNPLGVPTEREHYVQAQGGKVFRVLLVKK